MIGRVVSFLPTDILSPSGERNDAGSDCKFVLIRDSDSKYFVVGTVDLFPYHADLVARFCRDYEIPSGWVRRPDLVEIYDPTVKIDGGGMLHIDGKTRRVQIYGQSSAYGSFPDEGIVDLVGAIPSFRDYTVIITP